jgi:predicted nucleic acid-binding protein
VGTWMRVASKALPDESAIASITLAELASGPHATDDPDERSRRQDRLQWASNTWDPLPFDVDAARAYARVFAATRAAGRTSRSRLADLLIAATAMAHDLPIYTRNAANFTPLLAKPHRSRRWSILPRVKVSVFMPLRNSGATPG